ncbi:MAG: selenoneine synthase SenA [Nitrospinota bacterium]
MLNSAELADWVCDARDRTLELVADLSDDQLIGPKLVCVNPLLWEIGHMAWFQGKWLLRAINGHEPIRGNEDELYDSTEIDHHTRWDLPLPPRAETYAYMNQVVDLVLERIDSGNLTAEEAYHVRYGVLHEDMHTEAFSYTRQTLGYPVPSGLLEFTGRTRTKEDIGGGPLPGDVKIPGGTYMLGTPRDEPFAFDNEKWAHSAAIEAFSIARAAVTQAEFAAFVDDGGYQKEALWTEEGWNWRGEEDSLHPVHWRAGTGGWERRNFDRWVPLEPHRPVIHINFYEAEAYCRWAGRRLPTEAEWELAASGEPDPSGAGFTERKRRYPWGDEPSTPERANLDWRHMGCVDVGAFPKGDSAFGCRQMLGNTWEWTSSEFAPFPGFVADDYKDYSEPWFYTRRVLRGGAWPTRSRLARNLYRNYFTPERKDVWTGFRTCAL